jgi:hypothetical protein
VNFFLNLKIIISPRKKYLYKKKPKKRFFEIFFL